MGTTNSSLNNLESNELLKKFVSVEHISPDDPFWNQLLTFTFNRFVRTYEENKLLEENVSPHLSNLIQNNPSSKNIGSLTKVLIGKISTLRNLSTQEEGYNLVTWQTLNAMMILRFGIKYSIQNLSEENIVKALSLKSELDPDLSELKQIITSVVGVMDDVSINDRTYFLHCEAVNLLLILLSIRSNPNIPATTSTIYKCVMLEDAAIAAVLTKYLISNFIRQDLEPRIEGGSFTFGIYCWIMSAFQSNKPEEKAQPLLARSSLSLLLVLTIHFSNEENPYRHALSSCCDTQVDSVGDQPGFKIEFCKLFKILCATQDDDLSTLLLYFLLHKNLSFRAFVMSRTSELDTLTIPILKILYNSIDKSSHHIYMALIILLILSEDSLFNRSIHDLKIKNPSWYLERNLNEVSLGGLIILVIVRTIRCNISKTRDKFLHTNLLATLANMSNYFKDLSSHVCEKLVLLFEKLSKKLIKICNPIINGDALESASDCGTEIGFAPSDSQDFSIFEEVLRMILEIINSTLASQLIHNPNLVYTLLYKREVFKSFENHPSFQDIIFNIEAVLTFFSNRIDTVGDNPSVEKIYEVIQNSSLQWPANKLKRFPELKFRYVEDDQSEEFFRPYIWSLVHKSSGMYFDPTNVCYTSQYMLN